MRKIQEKTLKKTRDAGITGVTTGNKMTIYTPPK